MHQVGEETAASATVGLAQELPCTGLGWEARKVLDSSMRSLKLCAPLLWYG